MARLTPLLLVLLVAECCFSLLQGLPKDDHSQEVALAAVPPASGTHDDGSPPPDAKLTSISNLDSKLPGEVTNSLLVSKPRSALNSPVQSDSPSDTEENDDTDTSSDSEDLNSKSDSPSESDNNETDQSDTSSKDTDEDDSPSESDDGTHSSKDDGQSEDSGVPARFESDDGRVIYCGFPGAPFYGLVQPDKPLYDVGEYVSYICTSGAEVVGHSIRRCKKDGSWTHTIPVCDHSTCPQGKASLSYTMSGHEAGLAIDRNLTTCARTTMKWPRWWRLEFGREVSVRSLKITKSNTESFYHSFSIYLIETDGEKLIYHLCNTFSGRFVAETMMFKCNRGRGTRGHTLHIEDKRKENKEFDLCEVQLFFIKDQYECGEPDRLPFSTAERNSTLAYYSCQRGYKLTRGDRIRTCQHDGLWSGVPPQCEEIECQYPEHFENGHITLKSRKMGSVATHVCDDGFVLEGSNTRMCTEEGEWSLPRPRCVREKGGNCSLPTNNFYEFVNETVAVLRCPNGSFLAGADTQIHCENGSWSDPQAYCFDIVTSTDVENQLQKECNEEDLPRFYVQINDSVAEHQCPHDMLLYGHPYLYCQPDGTWSTGNATCYYEGEDPEENIQKVLYTEALLVALVCAGVLAFILVLTFFFWREEGGNEEAPLDRYEADEATEDVVPIITVDAEVTEPLPKPIRPIRSAPAPPETPNHVYDTPKPLDTAKTGEPLYAKVDLESKRRAKLAKESSSEEKKEEESPPPPSKHLVESEPPPPYEEEKPMKVKFTTPTEKPKEAKKISAPKENKATKVPKDKTEEESPPSPTKSPAESDIPPPYEGEEPSKTKTAISKEKPKEATTISAPKKDKELEEPKDKKVEEDKKASPKQVRRGRNLSKKETEQPPSSEDTVKKEAPPSEDEKKESEAPKLAEKGSKDAESKEEAPKRTRRRPLSPKISEESPSEPEGNPPKEEAQDTSLKRPPRQRRNF